MNKDFQRTDRVADAIQRELAFLLHKEVKDQRLKRATISAVHVAKDLSIAKVYFSVQEDQWILETLKVLNEASGFLRSKLSKRIHLRIIPKLIFVYDESQERGRRLTALIDKVIAKENENSE
ncbi:MAG TPA: 30S ribosome-binding factor RbfA [Gammaproteobacteria bacterium]|nr:30S ribosome-binding factor RbfA [Gammaproteobacteria bacterium]